MSSGTSSSSRSPSPISARRSGGPPVVVSSGAYHRERPDLTILAVTSKVRAAPTVGEAAIGKWEEAGLLKPSVLKPLLATIEKGLVLRRLGRLEEEDRRALRGVLDAILGQ